MSKMTPLASVFCINCINDKQIWFTFDPYFQKTIFEDNNGDFRKRCKRVKLENGAEFLLTSAVVY